MSSVMSADYIMWLQRSLTIAESFGAVMDYLEQVDPHNHYVVSMNERSIWKVFADESFLWSRVARTVVGHGQKLCVALKFNACCQDPYYTRSQERLLEVDRLECEVHVSLAIIDIKFVRPLFAHFMRVCPNLLTNQYRVEILDRCDSAKLKKKDGSFSNLSVKADAASKDLHQVRRSWPSTNARVQWFRDLHVTLSQTTRMWRTPPSELAGLHFLATVAPLAHRPKPSAQQSLGAQREMARAKVANRCKNTLRVFFKKLETDKNVNANGRAILQLLAGTVIWEYWFEQTVVTGEVVLFRPPLVRSLVRPYCCVDGQLCPLCDPYF